MEQFLESDKFAYMYVGICLGMYFVFFYPIALKHLDENKWFNISPNGSFIFRLFLFLIQRIGALIMIIFFLPFGFLYALFLPLIVFICGEVNFKKKENE